MQATSSIVAKLTIRNVIGSSSKYLSKSPTMSRANSTIAASVIGRTAPINRASSTPALSSSLLPEEQSMVLRYPQQSNH